MFKRFLLSLSGCLMLLGSYAQSIRGVVENEKKQPIQGALVVVDGTEKSTTTDASGKYLISGLKPATYRVTISMLGYTNESRAVVLKEGEFIMNVTLKEDAKDLEGFVVVGYGAQKRKEITGSITSISGSKLNDMPVPSFEAAIQGKAPGVQVTVGSGLAGSPSLIRIRGVSSVSAGGDPLYVVDGIPITQDYFINGNSGGMNNNPLATLNPDDIESIEILKDAAANAIYGSRGANGVILISTKRGKKGGWKFNFNTQLGVSMPTRLPDLLNNKEWLQMYQEAWENDGHAGRPTLPGGITWDQAMNTNTNWLKQTTQIGLKQKYNFSAGRSWKKIGLFANVSHDDNASYIKGNKYVRDAARLNFDYTPKKWLKMALSSSLVQGINQRVDAAWSGGLGAAMSTALPIYPIYNADGTYFRGAGLDGNPAIKMDPNFKKWRTTETRTINSMSLDIVPLKNFLIKAQGSLDYMDQRDDQWESNFITNANNKGQTFYRMNYITNYNYFITLNYNKEWKNHTFSAMAGNEYQRAQTVSQRIEAFDVDGPYYLNDSVSINGRKFNQNGTNWSFLSWFGRFNWNYKNRYFAQAVFRADASSRFGSNYRWAQFPSISGGWILSEEKFMKKVKWMNYAKIRAGYGRSGNANIPDDARFGTYSSSANTIGYNGNPTTFPLKLANENLRWETTDNFDAGIDLAFLKDRISLEFNFYSKQTRDVLMELTIPASNGFSTFWDNVGKISNKGVEFSLKTRNIQKKNFKWITEFNVARNYNKITSIGVYSEDAVSGGTNDTRVVVGSPVGTNYLIRYQGVDPATGLPIYLDKDGKETRVYDNKNRVPVGNILPKAIGGLTNTLSYKRFDLSFLIVFSYGSNIYESSLKRQSMLITNWNMDRRVLDRWNEPGQNSLYPRASLQGSTFGVQDVWMNTTLWLQDGSYARLRNLTFAYNLPNNLLKKAHLKTAKIAFIATNILTLTKYKGVDPEIARDAEGDSNGGKNTSRNMGAGNITYLTPPQEKTFNLSINIGF